MPNRRSGRRIGPNEERKGRDLIALIREIAKRLDMDLELRSNARRKFRELCGVSTFVLMHVLLTGDLQAFEQHGKKDETYICEVHGLSPDQNNRVLCLVIVPQPEKNKIIIKNMYWVDEIGTGSESFVGDYDD